MHDQCKPNSPNAPTHPVECGGRCLVRGENDPSRVVRCNIAEFEARIDELTRLVERYEEEYKHQPDARIVYCGRQEWGRFLYNIKELFRAARQEIHVGLPCGKCPVSAAHFCTNGARFGQKIGFWTDFFRGKLMLFYENPGQRGLFYNSSPRNYLRLFPQRSRVVVATFVLTSCPALSAVAMWLSNSSGMSSNRYKAFADCIMTNLLQLCTKTQSTHFTPALSMMRRIAGMSSGNSSQHNSIERQRIVSKYSNCFSCGKSGYFLSIASFTNRYSSSIEV